VLRIGELSGIEREINGLSALARLAERQKCSTPLPDNLRRGMPPSARAAPSPAARWLHEWVILVTSLKARGVV